MSRTIYEMLKKIEIDQLDDQDLEDLFCLFQGTGNSLVRNQIAFIFSDLKYNVAVPCIIDKIKDKDVRDPNGSLVYALENMDTLNHFVTIVDIMCKHGYTGRLSAIAIIKNNLPNVTKEQCLEALRVLERHKDFQQQHATDKSQDSTLHYIETVEDWIKSAIS